MCGVEIYRAPFRRISEMTFMIHATLELSNNVKVQSTQWVLFWLHLALVTRPVTIEVATHVTNRYLLLIDFSLLYSRWSHSDASIVVHRGRTPATHDISCVKTSLRRSKNLLMLTCWVC